MGVVFSKQPTKRIVFVYYTRVLTKNHLMTKKPESSGYQFLNPLSRTHISQASWLVSGQSPEDLIFSLGLHCNKTKGLHRLDI